MSNADEQQRSNAAAAAARPDLIEHTPRSEVLPMKRPAEYQAFLLRVWREDTHAHWRASLQSAATEHTYHFATLEALFAFLDGRLADAARPVPIDTDPPLREP